MILLSVEFFDGKTLILSTSCVTFTMTYCINMKEKKEETGREGTAQKVHDRRQTKFDLQSMTKSSKKLVP
jgi:hypothetical protein